MSDLNRVFVTGRLTRDPELRYTPQGTAVLDLGVAVNRPPRKGSNEEMPATFLDATCWGTQAEACGKYLRKGSKVLIEGELELDRWKDKSGENRQRLKVVARAVQFLDRAKNETEPADEPADEAR